MSATIEEQLFYVNDEIKELSLEEAELQLEFVNEELHSLGDVIKLTLGESSKKDNLNRYLDLKEELRLLNIHILKLENQCQKEKLF